MYELPEPSAAHSRSSSSAENSAIDDTSDRSDSPHSQNFEYLSRLPGEDEEIPAERQLLQDLGDDYYKEVDLDMLAPLVAEERTQMNLLSRKLSREKLKLRPSKEILAQGAHGVVLHAINLRTGELLVIKEVCLRDKKEPGKEIEREIHTMKLLSHPNVVGYRGVQRHDDKIWIVMEHCPGGSLAAVLAKFGPLETSVVRRYCKQICEGLSFLHRHGFVHCDVKCGNCLLGNEGVVKLADFGASRRLVKMGTEPKASGTLSHMAPEVIQQDKIGRQADVWSLGCTVMFMLTMTLPSDAFGTEHSETATTWRWLSSLTASPPPPSDVAEDAQDFIAECFTFELERRPSILVLLQHSFLRPAMSLSSPLHRTTSSLSSSSYDSNSIATPSPSLESTTFPLSLGMLPDPTAAGSTYSFSVGSPRSSVGSSFSERRSPSRQLSGIRPRRPSASTSSSSRERDSPLLGLRRRDPLRSSSTHGSHRAARDARLAAAAAESASLARLLWDAPFGEDLEPQFDTFRRMKSFRSWQRVMPRLLLVSSLLVAPTIIALVSPVPLLDHDPSAITEDALQVIALVCHFLSIAVAGQPYEADWVGSSGLLLWYARLSTVQYLLCTVGDGTPMVPMMYLYMVSFNIRLLESMQECAAVQAIFLASRLYHIVFALLFLEPVRPGVAVPLRTIAILPLLLQTGMCMIHFMYTVVRISGWRYEFLVISAKARVEGESGAGLKSLSVRHEARAEPRASDSERRMSQTL